MAAEALPSVDHTLGGESCCLREMFYGEEMFTITPGTVKASLGEIQSAKWGAAKGPFLRYLDVHSEKVAWDSGNIPQV